jgi:hypothetical protein
MLPNSVPNAEGTVSEHDYWPEKVSELRRLSEPELQRRHDHIMEYIQDMPGVARAETMQAYMDRARVYTDELTRREYVRQGEKMEALTRSMNRLSVVAVIATIAGSFLTALSLIFY